MKRETHTVTIPIEDYENLIETYKFKGTIELPANLDKSEEAMSLRRIIREASGHNEPMGIRILIRIEI